MLQKIGTDPATAEEQGLPSPEELLERCDALQPLQRLLSALTYHEVLFTSPASMFFQVLLCPRHVVRSEPTVYLVFSCVLLVEKCRHFTRNSSAFCHWPGMIHLLTTHTLAHTRTRTRTLLLPPHTSTSTSFSTYQIMCLYLHAP